MSAIALASDRAHGLLDGGRDGGDPAHAVDKVEPGHLLGSPAGAWSGLHFDGEELAGVALYADEVARPGGESEAYPLAAGILQHTDVVAPQPMTGGGGGEHDLAHERGFVCDSGALDGGDGIVICHGVSPLQCVHLGPVRSHPSRPFHFTAAS